ncbi:hypothetical protein GCM10009811_15360 [Nostocoides veronense]|uniref:Uncharacterized protein n=1 Tax=Nostocoides veronense TaxID=330836 RepID=A0ABN2LL53_9MICO
MLIKGGLAARGVEDERIAFEQAGDLLVADVAAPVGAAARHPICGNETRAVTGAAQLGIHAVHVRLLMGDFPGDHIGSRRRGGVAHDELSIGRGKLRT